ncbi:hypothetical protein A45J_0647 [hot springs metagenome]|uniref:Transposase n=1 Tax=hot springs metagenome TaxID=433727 RepID=A0A5J4L5W0_9ZZZZ
MRLRKEFFSNFNLFFLNLNLSLNLSLEKEFRTRELPENVFCLFIDAYHTSIKDEEIGRVKKAVIYVVVGIDLDGRKSLYGYYTYWGVRK